jgi:hypothetical protein
VPACELELSKLWYDDLMLVEDRIISENLTCLLDQYSQLNRAMFRHNGGCGYVLKPECVTTMPKHDKTLIQIRVNISAPFCALETNLCLFRSYLEEGFPNPEI